MVNIKKALSLIYIYVELLFSFVVFKIPVIRYSTILLARVCYYIKRPISPFTIAHTYACIHVLKRCHTYSHHQIVYINTI